MPSRSGHVVRWALNYLVKCIKSKTVKFRYIQHNNTNVLVMFTITSTKIVLKYTNVESAIKLDTKKVVLLHMHTLRDVYTTRL